MEQLDPKTAALVRLMVQEQMKKLQEQQQQALEHQQLQKQQLVQVQQMQQQQLVRTPTDQRQASDVLKRCDSGLSITSAFSSSSSPDTENYDDLTISSTEQLKLDRASIIYPILEFFDAKWLAPKVSPLFKRGFRKASNPDGSRVKKRNEGLDLKLFGKLIRIALRRIMDGAYMNNHNLMARYRLAAKKIITKRRANHNQSWRINNTHKSLIYGGDNIVRTRGMKRLPRKRKASIRHQIKFVATADEESQQPDATPQDTIAEFSDGDTSTTSAEPPISQLHLNKTCF